MAATVPLASHWKVTQQQLRGLSGSEIFACTVAAIHPISFHPIHSGWKLIEWIAWNGEGMDGGNRA